MSIEVLAVIDEMIARWNRKDVEAFAAMFAEDADFTDVLGQTAQGRPEIAAQHLIPFTRTLRVAKLTADHVVARTLGPDGMVARIHWTITGPLAFDGAALPTLTGKMQVAMLRGEEGWQIVSVLNQNPAGVLSKQQPDDGELNPPEDEGQSPATTM